MGTIKTTNIEPIADNGTVTLGSSGDTFSLGSGVVQSNMLYPAFEAYLSANQNISNTTATKMQFNTERFDTNSAYDNSTNYRFTVPSGEAGKYFFTAQWQTATATDFDQLRIYFYKNASPLDGNTQIGNVHYTTTSLNQILDLSASDYVEVYAFQESGGTINSLGTAFFQGFKLI